MSPPRVLFVAMMALWLVYPLAISSRYAQDAVPIIVAGQLAPHLPSALYPRTPGDAYSLQPEFRRRTCAHYPDGATCRRYGVAFISSPAAIPLAVAVALAGSHATTLLRELGAISLVVGMVMLWLWLEPRSSRAAWALASAAVLLTPLMTVVISAGQTSSLLFLAALVPLARTARWPAAVALGLALAGIIAFKGFPAAMLLVALWCRRWRPVVLTVVAVGVLSLCASLIAPAELWRTFLSSSRALSSNAGVNHSGSIDSTLYEMGVRATWVPWLLRLVIALPLMRIFLRIGSVDARWWYSWAAVLVLFPEIWTHYCFVDVAVIGGLIAIQSEPDRVLWMLPAISALTIIPSLIADGPPMLLLAVNVIVLGLAAFLTLGAGSDGPPRLTIGRSRSPEGLLTVER